MRSSKSFLQLNMCQELQSIIIIIIIIKEFNFVMYSFLGNSPASEF